MKRWWMYALVAVLLFVPQGVFAHTKLAESTPADGATLEAAPAEVVLVFDGELNEAATVSVTNSGGEIVDAGDGGLDLADVDRKTLRVSLQDDLPADSYTVSWTIVGEDGHEVSESIAFTVGAAPAETPTEAPATNDDTTEAPAANLPATGGSTLPLALGLGGALGLVLLGMTLRRRALA